MSPYIKAGLCVLAGASVYALVWHGDLPATDYLDMVVAGLGALGFHAAIKGGKTDE